MKNEANRSYLKPFASVCSCLQWYDTAFPRICSTLPFFANIIHYVLSFTKISHCHHLLLAAFYHLFLPFATICHPFATICHHLPRFATICHDLPPFATICHHVPPFATHLPPFATICHHLPPFATICHHLPPFATICIHLPPFAITCHHLQLCAFDMLLFALTCCELLVLSVVYEILQLSIQLYLVSRDFMHFWKKKYYGTSELYLTWSDLQILNWKTQDESPG